MWALSLSHRNIEAVCPLHYFVLIFSLTNTGNLGSVTVSRGSSFDGAIDFDYLDPSVTRIYAKFNGKIIPSPTLLHCRAFFTYVIQSEIEFVQGIRLNASAD